MKKLGNVLYILTEGSYLYCQNDTIAVKVGDSEKVRIPAHTVESIICLQNTTVTTPFIGFCSKHGISLSFHTESGRFLGRVYGSTNGNVLLRKKQYDIMDTNEALEIVRNILIGKFANSRNVLLKSARNNTEQASFVLRQSADMISESFKLLLNADNVDSMRGIEGSVASIYFSAFDNMLKTEDEKMTFEKRSRRPPENRVNALLSFVYMLLKNDVCSALESVGLDPAAGYLHSLRPGRESLALDIMEELRSPLCDRFVISIVNLKEIQSEDFIQVGSEIKLCDNAHRLIIDKWQKRKKEEITHPFIKEKIPIGLIPYCQAMLLSRHLRGDLNTYPPFFWR